ncbi:MAG: hypothetical protein HYZ51_01200 [Candidatus Doudnabacteria bacterium]|nr:hypothetical protein [Candidatus Doudnabacteria bacterium]
MKKIIATLLFLLAASGVIFWFLYPKLKASKPRPNISSFENCVKAGYAVLESYPRQCSLPDGRFFVESLIEERVETKP